MLTVIVEVIFAVFEVIASPASDSLIAFESIPLYIFSGLLAPNNTKHKTPITTATAAIMQASVITLCFEPPFAFFGSGAAWYVGCACCTGC